MAKDKKTARKPTSIDLAQLFSSVTSNLANNRSTLNDADTFNHNHGDNMVEIFQAITQAMEQKRNATPADQLAYASEILRNGQSGSAQLYAKGLQQAAKQFQGKAITANNAGALLQTLLSGGQAPASSPQAGTAGDMLSTLLGGTQSGTQSDSGLDVGDLLSAGMAFMDAKQRGGSNTEALINALIGASPMGQSTHRAQSGTLVANTILNVLGSLAKK